MAKECAVEYLYRYRSWDKNIWCGVYQPELTPAQIESAWGAWEFIDEQKYNEICGYIAWDRPCHYQAEKLLVTVVGHESFDPVEYIEQEKAAFAEYRKEKRERQNQSSQQANVSSFSATQSSAPIVDGYGLLNLAEGVVRSVGNAISSTASSAADVASDCASAIGEGISGMCE